jgi:Tol biopolymer transport system component
MTPGYSPPEQYGTARTDPRTDIYSLGATLYAALTGMIPEDGLARAMDNASLTPLRKRNPKISKRLSAAVERAMAVDPADRFQTAEDFKKALLGARARTERPTGEFTVTPPPTGSHVLTAAAAEARRQSQPRLSNTPLPDFAPEDKKVFVPPRKRRASAWPFIMLFALLVGGAGAYIFYPNNLFPGLRQMLPMSVADFFPTVRAMLPLPVSLSQSTATATPSSAGILSMATVAATEDAVPATATLRPTPTVLPPTATLAPTLAPTAMQADLGGGPGQIAFASNRSGIPEIYIYDLLARKVTPIINMPDGACQPAWSPDGTQLAFVSPCLKPHDIADPVPTDTRIYIAGADGSEPAPLNTGGNGDSEPAWSPDGKHIAFTSTRQDGRPLVYVVGKDGGTATLVTQPAEDFDVARQPAWSPAGNQIAFAKKRLGSYQIWAVTDAGQGEQQIVRSGQTFWDYLPVFSPDGQQVLFSERKAAGPVYPWQMYIDYELRGSSASQQVQIFPMPVQNAHFSPDGKWLVFEGMSANDNHDIFYAMPDGQERTRITTDPGFDFDPAWRP